MGYSVLLAPKSDDETWESVKERIESETLTAMYGPKPADVTWQTVILETGPDALQPRDRKLPEDALERWRRVIDRLHARFPGFTESGACGLSVQWTSPAVDVLFSVGEADIAVPYWYEGQEAADALRFVWDVATVIRDETGWSIYDLQQDAPLESVEDLLRGVGVLGGLTEWIQSGSESPTHDE